MSASTAFETLRPIHTKILKRHSCTVWILFNIENQSIHLYEALWKDRRVCAL